jgi:hypothetical protein
MQSFILILRLVFLLCSCHVTHLKQDLRAETWDQMRSKFREQVSEVYASWEKYLQGSLSELETSYYKTIMHEEASFDRCQGALTKLSCMLARRSERGVVVLIDEYEGPIISASEHGYFSQVCLYYPYQSFHLSIAV